MLDRDTQERVLTHLSRSISGEKKLRLTLQDGIPTSTAEIDEKEIEIKGDMDSVDDEQEYRLRKAHTFHETAHIRFTGSLRKLKQKFDEDGMSDMEYHDFKEMLNGIEDVRIENIMSVKYPQTKKYFVEDIDKITKTIQKRQGKDRISTKNQAIVMRSVLMVWIYHKS